MRQTNNDGENRNTILIIDDEPVIAESIRRNMRYGNNRCFVAEDGEEGLLLFRRHKPILVFLDLRMPVVDGFQFLERIDHKSSDPYAVVVVTGHGGGDDEIEEAYKLGASSFVKKPFNTYELRGLADNLIRAKLAQRELTEEIEIRKRTEEELTELVSEKSSLIQEIHHRVKNNMQIISSLFSIQAKYIDDKRFFDILQEADNRIQAMVLIQEQLYQSENFKSIDLGRYLEGLVHRLQLFYNAKGRKINVECSAENVLSNVDASIPYGLIVNELISNAIKHGFSDRPSGGKIEISLQIANDDFVELTVSDNGKGVPEDFDLRSGKSFGLHLLSSLVERQLRGNISVNSLPSEKTTFTVQIDRQRIAIK